MTSYSSRNRVDSSEVISTGWKLYRRNWKQYVSIALKGYVWLMVPAITVAVAAILLGVQISEETYANNLSSLVGLLVLAAVVFLVVSIFCFAQFLGWTTGISRLVYQTLSGGSEDEKAALRFTRSRKYALLWQNVLRGLIFLGIYLVFGLIVLIFALVVIGLSNSASEGGAVSLIVALSALQVLLFFAFFVFVAWVALRLMMADQSLAIEQDSSAITSINRSFEATKGNVWRSLQVAIFTFLISTVISMAFNIAMQIIATVLMPLATALDSPAADASAGVISYVAIIAIVLIFIVFSFAGAVFVLPLWHIMLTTLYFRLRSQTAPGRGNTSLLP